MRYARLSVFIATLVSTPALAVTDCPATPIPRLWNDSAVFWIMFQGGGIAKIPGSDTGREAYIALASTAFATGKTISPRYSANGANCNVERNDFIGM